MLTLFDKPDPLDGPFFEETIYVTPSRLSAEVQESIARCVTVAAASLALREGPVHAELRVNEQGPWMLEIAGRSIGGLCSTVLEFGSGMCLEELILRHAIGQEITAIEREGHAAGVMMIPIPCRWGAQSGAWRGGGAGCAIDYWRRDYRQTASSTGAFTGRGKLPRVYLRARRYTH